MLPDEPVRFQKVSIRLVDRTGFFGRTSHRGLAQRVLRVNRLRVRRGSHHHLRTLRRYDGLLSNARGGSVRRAGRPARRGGGIARGNGRLLAHARRGRLLVGAPPYVLHVVVAHVSLLVNVSVELGGVVSL